MKKMTDLIKNIIAKLKLFIRRVGSTKQHVKIILDTTIQPVIMADLIDEDTKQAIDNIIRPIETDKSVKDQFKDILKDQKIDITDGDGKQTLNIKYLHQKIF